MESTIFVIYNMIYNYDKLLDLNFFFLIFETYDQLTIIGLLDIIGCTVIIINQGMTYDSYRYNLISYFRSCDLNRKVLYM